MRSTSTTGGSNIPFDGCEEEGSLLAVLLPSVPQGKYIRIQNIFTHQTVREWGLQFWYHLLDCEMTLQHDFSLSENSFSTC